MSEQNDTTQELNNIYFVDAGDHDVLAEYCAGYPRYEREWVGAIVAAPTRGKARALFLDSKWNDAYLEWTDKISIRLIAKNIATPVGADLDGCGDYWALWEGLRENCPLALICVYEQRLPDDAEKDDIYSWLYELDEMREETND